jgi:hypothetical protein
VVPLRLSRGEIVDVIPAGKARQWRAEHDVPALSTGPIERMSARPVPVAPSLRSGAPRALGFNATFGETSININGSADEALVRKIDERVRAAGARQLKEMERNFGGISKRYHQMRQP